MPQAKQQHIVVVGAGAFGGWTALFLRRSGARVTLVDSWGPGNSRASSGGDTRDVRTARGLHADGGARAGTVERASDALAPAAVPRYRCALVGRERRAIREGGPADLARRARRVRGAARRR